MVLLLTFVVFCFSDKQEEGESKVRTGERVFAAHSATSSLCNIEKNGLVSKVIYFRNLPSSCFTDGEFVDLVKDQGKAVRYFLVPDRREVRMASADVVSLSSSCLCLCALPLFLLA